MIEKDAYDTCNFEADDDEMFCSRVKEILRELEVTREERDAARICASHLQAQVDRMTGKAGSHNQAFIVVTKYINKDGAQLVMPQGVYIDEEQRAIDNAEAWQKKPYSEDYVSAETRVWRLPIMTPAPEAHDDTKAD